MYFFRTVLFMPSVIAVTAVALRWSILLNPDVGVINQVLQAIGIAHLPRWLASRDWAIPALDPAVMVNNRSASPPARTAC